MSRKKEVERRKKPLHSFWFSYVLTKQPGHTQLPGCFHVAYLRRDQYPFGEKLFRNISAALAGEYRSSGFTKIVSLL